MKAAPSPILMLFLVVFVNMAGFGVVLPVFPFIGTALGADPAAVTLAMGTYSLGQFLGAPLWGKLSDRTGRRPVLLLCLVGSILAYVAMAFAHDILALGAARLFAGLMAGNIGVAFAYAGDVSAPADRPKAMGILGAAFGLGFIMGPAIGGLIAGQNPGLADFARVCWAGAALTGVATLLVLALLRESLTPERRAAVLAAGGGPGMGQLFGTKPVVIALMALSFLMIGAAAMMETVFAIFVHDRFAWGARDVGLSFALFGVITAGLQGGAAAPLMRRFGARAMAGAGIAAYGVGVAATALMPTPALMLVASCVTAVGVGLFSPAYQVMVADVSEDRDRGLINGLTQGISSLGRFVGPAVSGSFYQGIGPAAPFLIGAGVMAVALLLLLSMRPKVAHAHP